MAIEESNAVTLVGKAMKGKTFVVEDEKQVCVYVLHVSQDPITRNGQKNQAFWEQITTHYNNNCLPLVESFHLEAWRPSGVSLNMMWPNFVGTIIL
jgi:hypothetical protein